MLSYPGSPPAPASHWCPRWVSSSAYAPPARPAAGWSGSPPGGMKGAHSGSCTVDEKHTHTGMTQHREAITNTVSHKSVLTLVRISLEDKMYSFWFCSSPPNTHTQDAFMHLSSVCLQRQKCHFPSTHLTNTPTKIFCVLSNFHMKWSPPPTSLCIFGSCRVKPCGLNALINLPAWAESWTHPTVQEPVSALKPHIPLLQFAQTLDFLYFRGHNAFRLTVITERLTQSLSIRSSPHLPRDVDDVMIVAK